MSYRNPLFTNANENSYIPRKMVQRHNYLERIELNKKRKLEAGLISEIFPEVSGIVINMTYYQKGENPVLMIRRVNFWPSRHAYFNMDCMIKGCMDGGFDLTPVITHMIKKHKKFEKGNLVCKGKSDFLSAGHASIEYKITVHYNNLS